MVVTKKSMSKISPLIGGMDIFDRHQINISKKSCFGLFGQECKK